MAFTYYTFLSQAGVPQQVSVTLGGSLLQLTFRYRPVPGNPDLLGWVLDIADANAQPVINGIPLVTGCDLLAQFPDKNFGGQLVVGTTSTNPDDVPTFDNLGAEGQVYWVTST